MFMHSKFLSTHSCPSTKRWRGWTVCPLAVHTSLLKMKIGIPSFFPLPMMTVYANRKI